MADLDPKQLAFAIAKAAAGAVGSKVSGILVEQLTELIGLADNSMEQYYTKIKTQLSAIQDAQTGIQEMLQGILRSQTDIKTQIEDATLRAALQRFHTNRNTIASNYASLTQSFVDLPKDTRRAADEIYQVLRLTNANRIDEAMRNIHDEVFGEAESMGLIAMQHIICKQALVAWAQKAENLVTPNYDRGSVDGVGQGLLYWHFPAFPNNTRILTHAFNEAIPEVLEKTIVPMFHAFLLIQLQGLLMLQASWEKTAQSNRLQVHVANISNQIRAMEAFYQGLIARCDAMVDDVITTYGAPLPTYIKDAWADDLHWEGGNQVRPNNLIKCPITSEWKCWPVRSGDAAIGGTSTLWEKKVSNTVTASDNSGFETRPLGAWGAQVTIVKTPLRHDGKDRLLVVYAASPFHRARQAICYTTTGGVVFGADRTNQERDFPIPKPGTFVKLRITETNWKGYLPDISVPPAPGERPTVNLARPPL